MLETFKLNTAFPASDITSTFNECSTIVIEPHITWNSHIF